MIAAVALLGVAPSIGGCNDEGYDTKEPDAGVAVRQAEDEGWRTAMRLLDELPRCDVDHRGLLLDFGEGVLPGRLAWSIKQPTNLADTSHDGASWVRSYDRKITLSFYLPEVTPVDVSMRAIGRDASRVTVSIDGYALGTLKLAKDEIRVASTGTTSLPLDAGLHGIQLHFRGYRSADNEPYAEIDWLRIGVPDDDLKRTYGPPTMADILDPAASLGGQPHRALTVRAPASLRCAMLVPPEGRLRTAVGMNGTGTAVAAVVVRRDGAEAAVLQKIEVAADEPWKDVEVPLERFAGQVVEVELAALKTTGTGRLLFGDPTLQVPAVEAPASPKARAAVLVILDGVERRDLPPWSDIETPHLPSLSELARESSVFNAHRVPSTLVSAVVASLITGRSPREHRLTDTGAKLPEAVPTLGGFAHHASIRGAMFSAVPTSFAPFGFARHWDKFEAYPPNTGALAAQPFVDAGVWLTERQENEQRRPMLAVIHARGGHPPWDVTPPEASKLPPDEYAGYIGPRRGAQVIGKLEGKHSRLSEQDRQRLDALFYMGLSRQDKALGDLIRRLKEEETWNDTLFIVTGDVASGRRTLFQDGFDLQEELLTVPLYVHFPEGALAGASVDNATEVYDITRTIIDALGMEGSKGIRGRDLAMLAATVDHDVQRPRVAVTEDRYSARWGDYVLLGKEDERPQLCLLSVDPTCAYDRRHVFPAVAQALFRRLAATPSPTGGVERDPLTLDAEVMAMLAVWGLY